ncbi:MAG: UDP-3-O-(3-hydroxymyristoyl)glucosamine N-acyltransferase [Chitinophagaceae bacterium]|nr:UDP-3-O-(3-hydroxymyristoyl)glucosamine N-acyltransferase [Chitinophagaceae bacterium]
MTFTASQIALLVNGRVEGDANMVVNSFGKIEEAKEGQLAFLANLKYEEFLYTTKASVVLLSENYQLKHPIASAIIRVPDAYNAFATLLSKYQEIISQQLTGIQDPSYIAKTAQLHASVYVAAFAYIDEYVSIEKNTKIHASVCIGRNVKIGANTILHAGVKIYNDCVIGNNVVIHAGTVIGSDGFGFAPQTDGSFSKVPQLGNVIIEDDVEIGANTTVDRATIGSTIIHRGAKLDNLIQIAHNVEVGSNTVIAAQAGISGSTKLGKNIMMGGQAGIVGHLTIADGSKINAQSGVTKSIKVPNTAVTGTPAFDYNTSLRSQAISRNLPELDKRVKELEKIIAELVAQKNES